MPRVTVINHQGQAQRTAVQGLEAEDLLWSAGVDCGRWAPRLDAVSSVPQLSYARELLELQQRFGYVMTQRRRIAAGQAWAESQDVHVHDDLELRVVVQGVLRLSLGALTLGGWLQVDISACEWISLPPHLPHAAAPDPAHGVDVLCLFTQPGGWRARPTGIGPAPGLWSVQPPDGRRVGRRSVPAPDERWQPALAA